MIIYRPTAADVTINACNCHVTAAMLVYNEGLCLREYVLSLNLQHAYRDPVGLLPLKFEYVR